VPEQQIPRLDHLYRRRRPTLTRNWLAWPAMTSYDVKHEAGRARVAAAGDTLAKQCPARPQPGRSGSPPPSRPQTSIPGEPAERWTDSTAAQLFTGSDYYWTTLPSRNKKLSCRRETARRFLSLNILLSHSRSFETTLLSRACVSPYQYSIETMSAYPTVSEIFIVKKWRDLETGGRGRSRSFKMAPFDRSYTTFYWSAIVSIALRCTIFRVI